MREHIKQHSTNRFTLAQVQALYGVSIAQTPTGSKPYGTPCLNPNHPGDNDCSFRQAYVARMVHLAQRCLYGPDHNPAAPPGCRTMQEN